MQSKLDNTKESINIFINTATASMINATIEQEILSKISSSAKSNKPIRLIKSNNCNKISAESTKAKVDQLLKAKAVSAISKERNFQEIKTRFSGKIDIDTFQIPQSWSEFMKQNKW